MITEYGIEIDPKHSRAAQILEHFETMNVADLYAIELHALEIGDKWIAREVKAEIEDRNRVEVPWVYDDGGRSKYFKGKDAGDCVARSLAIVLERDYLEVYDALAEMNQRHGKRRKRSARDGVAPGAYKGYIGLTTDMNWYPTMEIGSGCTTHLRPDELPGGRVLVRCSKHITAMIDGVLHDTYDCSRDGTRCVYGYWKSD